VQTGAMMQPFCGKSSSTDLRSAAATQAHFPHRKTLLPAPT
jgi:hypothetical protein